MGASKVEQIGSGWCAWYSAVARRDAKRLLRRARRRAERKDIENVPPRHTKGWYW